MSMPEQAELCADKAERTTQWSTDFARFWVLSHLSGGPRWGEDLVEEALATGLPALQPHDGRAWGAVFGSLSKRSKIKCVRADGVRKKGHGTSGGRMWALA